MAYFILKRLVQSVFVMIAVAFLAFSLFRFVGDPITQMTGVETAIEDQERLREELGLNDPFVLQFYRFTGDMLQGDFGYSYRTRQSVGEMIASRIPATLELGTVALLISLIVGIPTGVYTALRPRGFVTQSILLTTLVGVSIPTFVIGIMLIFLFGVQLGWLPTFGRGGTVQIGGWESSLFTIDGWRALLLPAITLAFPAMATVMRFTRAGVLDAINSNYVDYQQAMGVPRRVVIWRYVLRNALIGTVTQLGLIFGNLIANAVVVEAVFDWPGLGLYAVNSILQSDYNAIMGFTLTMGCVFIIANLLVDIAHGLIDPREAR